MNPPNSRLKRNIEKQTKKQIITSTVGIVLLLFFLLKFGPYLIGQIGNLIGNVRGNNNQTNIWKSTSFLEPPILSPLPAGTDTQTFNVTGTTQYKDGTIEIFVNNNSYKNIAIDENGKFKQEVKLSEGVNTIHARVKEGDKASDFSRDYTIKYSKSAPKLEISSPSDGTTFQKADQEINVTGKTDPDSTVTVKGFRAIVADDGSFSYYLKLSEGDNEIKIVAQNPAGKTTEKIVKASYKP